VNFLSRIVRIILSAILLGAVIALLRRSLSSRRPASRRRPAPAPGPVPLFRDPSCGTFVSPEISLRLEQGGQVHHFCSEQCRDRFLHLAASESERRNTRRAAGA